MSDEARQALHRLKRRVGREAGRFGRIYEQSTSVAGRERAFGEHNVCRIVQGFIDEELARLVATEERGSD